MAPHPDGGTGAPRPVPSADRIRSIDTLRGVVLLGILLVIIFGMVHGYLLLWPGDVLFGYGIVGLFLFRLRHARPAQLAIASGLVVVLLSLQGAALLYDTRDLYPPVVEARAVLDAGGEVTDAQQAALDEFSASPVYVPSADEVEAQLAQRRGGYVDNLTFAAPLTFLFQTVFLLFRGFWDSLAMMLLGMALFTWGVFDASRARRDYGLMVVIGFAAGLAANYHETSAFVASAFNPAYAFPATYDIGRLGCAFGYIGLVMLLCKSGAMTWLQSALAAVGRMALTNYMSHSVIAIFIFSGVGLGLVGRLERHELYYVVGGVWLFQLVASPLWLRRFRYGPLEWIWRSLTYRRIPPMVVQGGVPR